MWNNIEGKLKIISFHGKRIFESNIEILFNSDFQNGKGLAIDSKGHKCFLGIVSYGQLRGEPCSN